MADKKLTNFPKTKLPQKTKFKRNLTESSVLKKDIMRSKLRKRSLPANNRGSNDLEMIRSKSEIETRLESESNLQSNTGLDVITEESDNATQPLWGEPDSDEDYEMLREFDVEKAWRNLLSLPDCIKVPLNLESQKKLELEIGKNITEEYPWKQIKFRDLVKLFDDDIEVENLKRGFQVENLGELHSKFVDISLDDSILVTYMPLLDYEEDDYFVFYGSHESARRAGLLIENIEKYERWLLNKILLKKTRFWASKGSEYEVNLVIPKERTQTVDVEFESVYPIQRKVVKLSERQSNDVRDGYVELLPGDKKFDNIYRRRVDIGIQSSRKKITLEQQTNPTFPSNVWTQYKYDIDANELGLDKSDDENEDDKKKGKEDSKPPSKGITPTPNATPMHLTPLPPQPPPKLSENVEYLLETIEFNQVDMYRNDYEFISSGQIEKDKISKLEEILSFASISKSLNRIVCALDWYPTLSGVLVASYTFTNLVTSTGANEDSDFVAKTILERNPVLMWSFSDNLKYKLEFEAPREVTALSFCPFDDNVLLGGTINGTLIIWDLQNRLEKLDKEEILTVTQLRYRTMIQNHLFWTKQFDENTIVHPAAVSSLQGSQNGPITAIKWLDRGCTISRTGQIRKTDPGTSKYFLTISLDGSIAFWQIESTNDIQQQISSPKYKYNIPVQLVQNISVYKKYDRVIKPIFIIELSEPITNILIDSANFRYEPVYNKTKHSTKFETKVVHLENIEIKVEPILRDEVKQKLHVSTLYGQVMSANWEGLSQTIANISKEKIISTDSYAKVHDGPIITIERNKFMPNIFITVGGTILAVWYEGYTDTPLAWRQIGSKITQVYGSSNRPGVLYLATADGTFQVWDMLFRSEIPSVNELLGGGIISLVSEPIISIPKKVISIGDYNSNLKIYHLPSEFYVPVKNEKELVELLLEHVKIRKSTSAAWQKSWLEKNADIIAAKKSKEEEKQEELEKLQREMQDLTALKLQREEIEQKTAAEKHTKRKVKSLTEILEKKWDEFNLKRIIDILLKRKHLDPAKLEKDTALEKERLKYIKEKKDAIKRSYHSINEDLSEIRAKLLPIQKTDLKRIDLINEFVMNIINQSNYDEDENYETYEMIENDCSSYIENHPSVTDLSYYDFFINGKQRRDMLNRSLGNNINNKRREYYENLKINGKLSVCNFGKNLFSNLPENSSSTVADEKEKTDEDRKNNKSWSSLTNEKDESGNNKDEDYTDKKLKEKDVEFNQRHLVKNILKENA